MRQELVSIQATDGGCPVHVFTPEEGIHPAVILYMDGFGIRPTILQMAERLAEQGYAVFVPDLFYRAGEYGPLNPNEIFAAGDVMGTIGELFASTDPPRAAEDTRAILDYIDSRSDVDSSLIGTTGYCLGGAVSMTVAGTYPDRIKAAASFHAGGLVTDEPTSPHILAPNIRARVYVAGADHDANYTSENAEVFDAVLSEAGVRHRCEIYPDARHGFTMTDFPVYNEEAATRHWDELFGLFGSELQTSS